MDNLLSENDLSNVIKVSIEAEDLRYKITFLVFVTLGLSVQNSISVENSKFGVLLIMSWLSYFISGCMGGWIIHYYKHFKIAAYTNDIEYFSRFKKGDFDRESFIEDAQLWLFGFAIITNIIFIWMNKKISLFN